MVTQAHVLNWLMTNILCTTAHNAEYNITCISITAEIRPMKKAEVPLKLHLQYGVDSPYLDIRLVQVRDSRVHIHRGEGAGESYSDEEGEEEDGSPPSLVPKDEGETSGIM